MKRLLSPHNADRIASIINALSNKLQLIEIINFASTYYIIGTLVLKPLLIQAIGKNIDVADPGMEWNRFCAQLP